MDQTIELHKQRNFSEKISASLDFIRLNAKPLFKACLVIAGPVLLVGALITGDSYQSMITAMSLIQQDEVAGLDSMSRMGVSIIIGSLVTMLGGLLVVAVVYQYMRLFEKKQSNDITVGEVWQKVKQNFGSLLATALLYVVLLMVIGFAIALTLGLFGSASPVLTVILLLPAAGFLTYVAINFSLVLVIESFESRDALSAFSRSASLIKGNWWSTFALILVTSIIASMVTYMISIITTIVMMAGMLHEGELAEPTLFMKIITYITVAITSIIGYLVQVLPLLAMSFQYFNLVELKEARGLMNKIESFGEADLTASDEEHY